jgi:autotransporter-associated beta strand protein
VTNSSVTAATLTTGGNNFSSIFSGLIQNGTGVLSLTKIGTGTSTLSGNNTYTGDTTISAGTLQVGNGGTAGTLGSVNVAISSISSLLKFNRSDTITVTSNIGGTGGLTQAGTGITILTGSNSYGTTTISAGTLQVGNGGTAGTLGSGNVAINSINGLLSFNRSDDITVTNDMSGTGSLTQLGAGTTTLTGNNSYGGTTTISAGTLQVGNGDTTGTLGTGSVVNNTNLVFARAVDTSIANSISGMGNVSANITSNGGTAGNLTINSSSFGSGRELVMAAAMVARAVSPEPLPFAPLSLGPRTLTGASAAGPGGLLSSGCRWSILLQVCLLPASRAPVGQSAA